MTGTLTESDPGPRPELAWISLDELSVDAKYQRGIDGDRSQSLIRKISQGFSWSKFQTITVAKRGKKYAVIDGQHRLMALLERGDIEEVPCMVIDADNTASQAESFVAINKDRVRLHPMALFHAEVASGDERSVRLKKILDSIDISIPKSPVVGGNTKPREVQSIGTLQRILKNYGEENLKASLSTIVEAFPDTTGQMRSMFIQALAAVYACGSVDRKHMVRTIRELDPESLQDAAREYVQIEGGSIHAAMVKGLLREYNKPLKKGERLKLESGAA